MDKSPILDHIRHLNRDFALFSPGKFSKVIVAVSGGTDSLALLACLLELREELQLELHVATLDHSLRGVEGAEDAAFVAALAEQWKLPMTQHKIDVPALLRRGDNLEAVARRERYAFLQSVAQQHDATTIATAHHLDDQAETILLHVLRGSGLAGLRGILPKSTLADGTLLVRPLLTTTRDMIEEYVRALGITPRRDSMNQNMEYMRNYLRHEIMPHLERINPAFRSALYRLGNAVTIDYDFLLSTLPELSSDHSLEWSTFVDLHPAQQRHLILQAARHQLPDVELSHDDIERVRVYLHSGRGDGRGALNGFVRRRGTRIYFGASLPYPLAMPCLPRGFSALVGTALDLPGGWRLEREAATRIPTGNELSAVLKLPSAAVVALRVPRNGDRFQNKGMEGKSQKLSDLLINLKVPQEWRSSIPLLTVNDNIAWILAPTMLLAPNDVVSRISALYAPKTGDSLDVLTSFRLIKHPEVINR